MGKIGSQKMFSVGACDCRRSVLTAGVGARVGQNTVRVMNGSTLDPGATTTSK